VVTAKVAASVLAGLVFGVVAAALAFAAGYPTIAGRGAGLALTTRDLLLLFLGTVAFAGLWGGLGCGFGALVRNQVGAIVGLLLWFLVVEALLRNVVPSVGRFAPGAAGDALIGDSAEHLLSPAAGGAVLLGWMALFALVGAVAVSHRDVP
jgi:hypothetical protein